MPDALSSIVNMQMGVLYTAAAVLLALLVGFLGRKVIAERKLKSAGKEAEKLLAEARRDAATIRKEARLEAKDELYALRQEVERETREKRQEIGGMERRLLQKEENLDKKVDLLDKKENDIANRERSIVARERSVRQKNERLESVLEEEKRRLQEISGLTISEAKKILFAQLEADARREAALKLKRIEEELRENSEKKGQWILSQAIQRCASEHVVESTVSVVSLPNDEMKGRIIGREGRNIRALENATGIDIIVDDTPEAVILSGYEPIRREVARRTLARLITDGRIHPARIEEMVEKVREELDVEIRDTGEQAALDTDIQGLHPEEVKLIGRLKFRTSYGQNVLQHSMEVAHLAGIMAGELGVSVRHAKRAAFLHDIGKAVDHEMEGSHAGIGAELARKYGESDEIVRAIAAHHNETQPTSVIDVLTQAADAVSAARPGARRETLETYVKRLEKLEHIADSFIGVDKAYAIQAGREIRIMVEPEKVSDADAYLLARDITKKVESELEYPGQIKITVIRETRVVELAK